MTDPVRESLQAGHLVMWEEVARDGAQAKTLLSGRQRVRLAQLQAAMFGEHSHRHLVFAVGYPAICQEEFDAIRQVVHEVDNCSLVTHGRASRADIDLGLGAIAGARFGRVSYAIPTAEKHSWVMLHQSQADTLRQGIELAKYARDKADGVPIDVALGGAVQADPSFLAEAAVALTEAGVSTVKVCDSAGERFPAEIRRIFGAVLAQVPAEVAIGAHLHNDYGLALANNLETIQLGVRLVATSWLGLAERVGLAATEQLLFALTESPDKLKERLGIDSPLWLTPPDLKQLVPIAREVSQTLGIPLNRTDPIVSPAMNHIATGAYFNDPSMFRPFDPQEVLGVPPQLTLTHLANHSIVQEIADNLGYQLNSEQTSAALKWVKSQAYKQNCSVISQAKFADFLADLGEGAL
jgi:2-isopropylmalate synthase